MAEFNTEYYQGEDRYSDGDVEERILQCVMEEGDREVPRDGTFPVLYHLSPVREGILSWYPFREGARVLEIGAGPGAITGLLCRKCAEVVSVDLSLRRSKINYERHKDYGNLTVMVGNLNDMDLPPRFDYVILNGVFEYAGSFTEGKDPYGTFLRRCAGYLAEDGILLTAIENRLGLKYFSGAPEDHTDGYMDGLKDYPGNTSVHTFSKAEWEELCGRCGLPFRRFYYPYPDYKFPSEVFTDGMLTADRFRRNAWNFNERRVELFPEAPMAAALAKEGVLDRFMNSFLIEMSRKELPEEQVLYAKMNHDRGAAYRIQTIILEKGQKDQERRRSVQRGILHEKARVHMERMHEREMEQKEQYVPFCDSSYRVKLLAGTGTSDGVYTYPYLEGISLTHEIARAAAQRDKESAGRVLREAVGVLEELICGGSDRQETGTPDSREFAGVFGPARSEREYRMACPANIDLIFDNLILEDDVLYVIDGEWVFDFSVPVLFILWRALNELYVLHPEMEEIVREEDLFKRIGILPEDRQLFRKWADHFEREYVGANRLAGYAKPVRKVDLGAQALTGAEARATATLYLDRGKGFCEEDSVHCELLLKGGGYDVTFDVPDPDGVRSMRFDPIEGAPCVCSLTSEDVKLIPLNSSADGKHGAEFLTQDPAYKVRTGRKVPERIRITGKIRVHDLPWALARSQALLRRSPAGAAAALRRKLR